MEFQRGDGSKVKFENFPGQLQFSHDATCNRRFPHRSGEHFDLHSNGFEMRHRIASRWVLLNGVEVKDKHLRHRAKIRMFSKSGQCSRPFVRLVHRN